VKRAFHRQSSVMNSETFVPRVRMRSSAAQVAQSRYCADALAGMPSRKSAKSCPLPRAVSDPAAV
jgi:hypothetical protein